MRFYRHEDFPFLDIAWGKPLPADCFAAGALSVGEFTRPDEVDPETWLTERGAARVLALTEQALGQANGYALTLLQAELDEEE